VREVVDSHTHVWPDALAGRALAAVLPELQRHGDGTVSALKAVMARSGVDRSVCLAVASSAKHVEGANRFAASLEPTRFIGFGAIHPELSPGTIVASLRKHGLKGVKIHPLFQKIDLADPRLSPILDALQGEFVVTVHVGAGGESDETNSLCTPDKLLLLVKRFPRLQLIACHFGGYRLLDQAQELLIGQPIHLDTAWPPTLGVLDLALVRRLVKQHGVDRIVFGSDWPMADPEVEMSVFNRLGLPSNDIEAILGGNMLRLLGQSR
jgi:predicted TIM-barrel fold metal-dependent hydrolase